MPNSFGEIISRILSQEVIATIIAQEARARAVLAIVQCKFLLTAAFTVSSPSLWPLLSVL